MSIRTCHSLITLIGVVCFIPLADAQASVDGTASMQKDHSHHQTLAAKRSTQADRDWDALNAIIYGDPKKSTADKAKPTAPQSELIADDKVDPKATYNRFLDTDRLAQNYSRAAMLFFETHPNDPRRWSGVVQMGFVRPLFITGMNEKFLADPSQANLKVDNAARDAFTSNLYQLLTKLDQSADAPKRARIGAYGLRILDAKSKAARAPSPGNREAMRVLVERIVEGFPDDPSTATSISDYQAILDAQVPAEGKAFSQEIAARHIPAVIAQQKAQRAQMRSLADLAQLKFVALDGRSVDVGAMRGKVVLIDFWATWCGPCIAEMPNVKKAYTAWHDKGFEVIGVTIDKQEDREKVLRVVKKLDIPWPQHFDGMAWDSVAKKYRIDLIPAMFLLDTKGQVASREARGPKLEAEVKRLLGVAT